ncbi:MAG: hypothetical protein K2H41_07525 [Acetatifactor sp.]|nr:hypothetical protein [Acetatifactor sp.]
MDKLHYEEMKSNLNELIRQNAIQGTRIYLFGHCNATEELVDLLLEKGFMVTAILDNNTDKHGNVYRNIPIKAPEEILSEKDSTIVCIAARAYAAMAAQLRRMGYTGPVRKLVDYNSYAEYSLEEETITRMNERRKRGSKRLESLKAKYRDCFRILCPFSALGDIYIMMSYLPHFMRKRGIENCVVGVIGNGCAKVVRLFGSYQVETFAQKDMDEVIQAALYEGDEGTFIPHQDRPYVVNLSKAMYFKPITLEQMYCCGVFGLPEDTRPYAPVCFAEYGKLETMQEGRAVILSPYAKSVTALPACVWEQIVVYYVSKGYQCFTNVSGDEKPLPGTAAIAPSIAEMKSVVERAGTFVGIRSGLCDVIRDVNAKKIALYPDYNYSDTPWKAIDIYALDGWTNIVVKGEDA